MDYLYMQSIVQYRIPIKEDGTLGNPEVTTKFTTEKGKPKSRKKKPKKKVQLYSEEVEEMLI